LADNSSLNMPIDQGDV